MRGEVEGGGIEPSELGGMFALRTAEVDVLELVGGPWLNIELISVVLVVLLVALMVGYSCEDRGVGVLVEHTDACVAMLDCGCEISEIIKLGRVPSVDTRVNGSSLLRVFVDAS